MQFISMHLKNFRCFKDLKIVFPGEYTVLVGVNGAGKSSILDAIAILLGGYLAGLNGVKSNALHQEDVRYRMFEQGSVPNREAQFPARLEAKAVFDGREVVWARSLNGENGRTRISEARAVMDYAVELQQHVRQGELVSGLPLVAYYGTGRLWAQKKNRRTISHNPKTLSSRMKGYQDCLDAVSNEGLMLQWFAQMTYLRLQEEREIPELSAVERAVAECYKGIDAEAEQVKVRFSVKYGELEIVVRRKNRTMEYLPLHLLSDGIRTILNMVADIAYRSAVLNPQLLDKVLQDTDGIVLIDEIDMHLHPAWQKRIISDLLRIFPKMQFIFTTHAPSVLANVPKEHILILDDGRAYQPRTKTYGRNVSDVLREVMAVDVRPNDIHALIRQFDEALDGHDFTAAKLLLTRIQAVLGENDAEAIQAQMALDFEEEE